MSFTLFPRQRLCVTGQGDLKKRKHCEKKRIAGTSVFSVCYDVYHISFAGFVKHSIYLQPWDDSVEK